jgi:hypothetical protein
MEILGQAARWWRQMRAAIVGWSSKTELQAAAPQGPAAPRPPAPLAPSQRPPNDVFTPTRPRSGRRNLVGRQVELERILDAVLLDSGHVVLYSERGRGKTSLSNMAIEALRRRGVVVGRFACEAQTQFDTLIRGLMRDLPNSLLAAHDSADDAEGCEAALPDHTLRPADVAAIPALLSCKRVVFVVDEFDRVQDGETRTRLADTIKLLSDRGLPLSLIIVGVSATLEQIIGQHPSIERNIMPIHLPLLEDRDIAEMLRKGGNQAGLEFSDKAVEIVSTVARGMPYMAQLMGLRIAQASAQRGAEHVEDADILQAVQRLLRDANPTIISSHAALITGDADRAVQGALERIANADQDQWGRIAIGEDGAGIVAGGQSVPSRVWALLRAANVLASPDGNPNFVQFQDRALMYHVQLLAARDRLVAEANGDAGTRQWRKVASHA